MFFGSVEAVIVLGVWLLEGVAVSNNRFKRDFFGVKSVFSIAGDFDEKLALNGLLLLRSVHNGLALSPHKT
jgi:hypothetical protein